jgi:hypothetical protein
MDRKLTSERERASVRRALLSAAFDLADDARSANPNGLTRLVNSQIVAHYVVHHTDSGKSFKDDRVCD